MKQVVWEVKSNEWGSGIRNAVKWDQIGFSSDRLYILNICAGCSNKSWLFQIICAAVDNKVKKIPVYIWNHEYFISDLIDFIWLNWDTMGLTVFLVYPINSKKQYSFPN